MTETSYDLLVIGAGPGGYEAAIRAAQLGLKTACVERESALGGTCLRVGCIPSKALLEASELYHRACHELGEFGVRVAGVELDLARMQARKDRVVKTLTAGVAQLFKKNGVVRYEGHATIVGPGLVEVTGRDAPARLRATNVLLATGSKSAPLPGVELDGERVGTSTEALAYPSVPEHLVVIGAGVIGLELGSVWSRLGARVTVVEYLDRILPGVDAELALEAKRSLTRQGLEFRLKSRVLGARASAGGALVEVDGEEPLRADRVLLAVGRVPNTEGLGLEAVGIRVDARGRIPVDAHGATSAPGFFAVGDVTAGPMLAHKASEEGIACVERLVTGFGHVDYDLIPGVVYTSPELATVGRSEEQLVEAGIAYKKGSFPFAANGRARALGATEGRVKLLADAATDRVLGVHILGPSAGELIAEAAAAMAFGASAEDLARTCHAHPTLAEALKEAALASDGRAINV